MRMRLTLCLLTLGLTQAAIAGTHTITPADISAIRGVSDASIAPDGRRVVYVVQESGDGSKPGPTRLWLTSTDGKPAAQFTGSVDGDGTPRWSHDGTRIGFIANRGADGKATPDGKDPGQLWIADADGHNAHRLGALAGAVSAWRWSPDDRTIAAVVGDKEDPSRAKAPHDTDDKPIPSRVWLIDTSTGDAHPITPPGLIAFDVDFSPDGALLAVRAGDTPGLEDYWYRSRIELRRRDGTLQATLPGRATAAHATFSPDGKRVIYGHFNPSGITGGTAIYDIASAQVRELGAGSPYSLREISWDADGRGLTGIGFVAAHAEFVRVDASTGKVATLAAIKGDPYDFSRARDGSIAFVGSARTQPEEVWLLHDDRVKALTDTNPQVRGWRLGTVSTVQWTNSHDGKTVYGVLVVPADAKPGKPLKLLVQIHGGPLDAWWDGWLGSWHNWAQLLAGHGYAVLMPNPRGSDGQGDAFAEANKGDWGGADYQDILDGVDMLVKKGIADPKRLAIGGWSYGCFMSAWAAGHNDRFRTAIIGAAPTDLASMAMTTDVGYSFVPSYFGDPQANAAAYREHSPLSFVDKVNIPVLILHGEADRRVPPFLSLMFYNALKQRGAPATMVTYPGAPHWFGGSVGTDTASDVQSRVLAWLDAHIEPEAGR